MFAVGDAVMYGMHGVCRVEEVSTRIFCDKTGEYYTLRPCHQRTSVFYVPVDRADLPLVLRPLSDRDSISRLIAALPTMELLWEEDPNARKRLYNEVLKTYDRQSVARLIKTVRSFRKQGSERRDRSKSPIKLYAADEKALADAERLLFEEIATVFDIPRESVPSFFFKALTSETSAELT